MKVTEKIKSGPILSIEILPPNRGQNMAEIYDVVDQLLDFPLDLISVTRHPPETTYLELPDKIIKIPKVKRPGSLGITAALLKKYNLEVMPHVLCYGMSKYEIEDLLIDLNLLGIKNVFVIRGEYENQPPPETRDEYQHAVELVAHISNLNRGLYLYPCEKAYPTDFCIGVAGYPEKHVEAPNLNEDLRFLKAKIETGADFVITQMLFDFEVFKRFKEKLAENSINIPLIPGIKPVVSLKTIYNLPGKFFISIPDDFICQMKEARTEEDEFRTGIEYMSKLAEKLLLSGAAGLHIFTMGKGRAAKALLKAIYG
jgi:methylenetetrahydrofolate reductase (NADPH)